MAQLDLGRVTLRARDSRLQLHLNAAVRFSRLQKQDTIRNQESFSRISHLAGNWVTEAPDMELRFFINGDWALRGAVDTLVTGLKGKICGLEIWSDLGFSAVLHTKGDEETDILGAPNLRIGLHRKYQRHHHRNRRTLPIAMTNPPDVCPPEDIVTANLTLVDVSMEFCFHDEQMQRVKRPSDHERNSIRMKPPDVGWVSSRRANTDPKVPFPIPEEGWLKETHKDMFPQNLRTQMPRTSVDGPGPSNEEFSQLFELGVRKLIISNTIKAPTVRVSKENTLNSLPNIAPAIFKAGYREAINQRGVTIPIITKAISTMLKGDRASLEGRLAESSHTVRSSNASFFEQIPHTTNLKTEVHSRLWHIAQERTIPPRPLNRRSIILSTASFVEKMDIPESTGQPYHHEIFSNTTTNIHTEQREEDDEIFASLLNEPGSQSESEDQILDYGSETSFIDLGESTQTSLDTLFPTAASSQTAWSEDESMLFSDFVDVADCTEDIVRCSYPLERTEDHDADIIMSDGV